MPTTNKDTTKIAGVRKYTRRKAAKKIIRHVNRRNNKFILTFDQLLELVHGGNGRTR